MYKGRGRELNMGGSYIKVELESPLEIVKGFLYLDPPDSKETSFIQDD